MYNGIVNKIKYDDLGKPMKQTSFTIKNLGGHLPKNQSTIVEISLRSSTKPLSLDSTILVNELIVETFYHFKNFEPLSIQERAIYLYPNNPTPRLFQ